MMCVKYKTLIRETPLFTSLDSEKFEYVLNEAELKQFQIGDQITSEQVPADVLHVIIDGTVFLLATFNGKETLIEQLNTCRIFHLAAVIGGGPQLVSARAASNCAILMIPAQKIRSVFASDTGFSKSVVCEIDRTCSSWLRALKNQKLKSCAERLANYLLLQELEQGGSELKLPLEKRALASLLGMSPENLSRVFGALSQYGVKVDGAVVRITNPMELATFAKQDPLIDDAAS